MTVAVTHRFVSPLPDDTDPSTVSPSNWNDTHSLQQATGKLLGRTTAGTGDTEEITPDATLSLSAGALGVVSADLTRVSDTNVTLTLGGTPTGAVLKATSLTVGWTGTLAVARGGTGGGSASGTLLDNITGFASTGHLVRTAAGTYAFRTLTQPAAGITVTNGDGVAASPSLALANDLAAYEGLSTTGLVVRSATDTAVTRTLASASAGLTWTNGDGVSGNPTPVFANDLGALEALSGTSTQYYRSGTDAWSAVTYGTGVTFSGGVLTVATLNNTRLAKTANYTVSNSDKGKTLALGGATYFTLTFSAASGYDADFSVMVLNEDTVRAKTLAINGITSFFLYPGQSLIVFNQNNTWSLEGRSRWRIPSGTTTVFVNQSVGNDANDGLAVGAGNAMATLTAAMTRVSQDIDVAGNSVLVQMGANESGAGGLHLGLNGFFIGTGGGAAITLDGGGFTLDGGGSPAINLFFAYGFTVQNIKLQGANAISLDRAHIRVGSSVVLGVTTGSQLLAANGSKIEVNGALSISGGSAGNSFAVASSNSVISIQNSVTFTASVVYGAAVVRANTLGLADFSNATFSLGAFTVTGTRWSADSNGVVVSGTGTPNTFFPGNVNGTTGTGGQGL